MMVVRAKKVISTALVCSSFASPLAYGETAEAAMPNENFNENNQIVSLIVKDALTRYFNPFAVIEGGLTSEPSLIAEEETYIVQKGDVLGGIALKYDVTVEQLMQANNLTNPDRLSIGAELKIPVQKFHRVIEGETLEGIASSHDVKVDELILANAASHLTPEALFVGQTIKIPEKPPEIMTRAFTYKPKEGTVKVASRTQSVASVKLVDMSFSWPLDGILTSKYGTRWGRMHRGIDVSHTNKKANIAAALDGVVAKTERNSGLGLHVIIDHGNGVETVYAHLSKISVEEGDKVKTGDILGKMGNTGHSYGSHLHFEIRKDGESLNPLKYLP